MSVEPMDCAAPEHGLIPFLAAGTLDAAEREAASAHARTCAVCQAELQEVQDLLAGLRASHLTADEIVEAAETGEPLAHLDVCSACRAERDALREVNATLVRATDAARWWRHPGLGWAAALVLALPAGLFAWRALHPQPEPDGPVTRGPAATARVSAPLVTPLREGGPALLPRGTTLLEFPLPGAGAATHCEAELVDARGITLWAGTLPEGEDGRGRLLLDAEGLAPGRVTLDVRRLDAAGVEQARAHFELTLPPS